MTLTAMVSSALLHVITRLGEQLTDEAEVETLREAGVVGDELQRHGFFSVAGLRHVLTSLCQQLTYGAVDGCSRRPLTVTNFWTTVS